MNAYHIQTSNAKGRKTGDWFQFGEDEEDVRDIADCLFCRYLQDGEKMSLFEQVEPSNEDEAKLFGFAALLQEDRIAQLFKEFGRENEKSGTDNKEVHLSAWPVKVVYGRKYINVDVGGSGVYMVTKDEGDIFSIKGYGVIHRGHQFGTLDTIDHWWWGEYRGRECTKRDLEPLFTASDPEPAGTPAPAAETSGRGRVGIPEHVEAILRGADIDGNSLSITQQLGRADYAAVNKVLELLGGKWNRSAKAHIFPAPVADVLEAALDAGQVNDTKKEMDQFDTPKEVARKVAMLAEVEPGHRVLEPSAGTGRLLAPMVKLGAYCVAVEMDPDRCETLAQEFGGKALLISGDFLNLGTYTIGGPFDRIVMNPPFYRGEDIKHIRHAFGMLAKGGVLVAICADGPKQHEAFRDAGEYWEELPAGSFKASGTNVNTAVVVLNK